MRVLIKNIKELLQIREKSELKVKGLAMKSLPTLKNAYLLIDGGIIADFGLMKDLQKINADKMLDAKGKMVLPTWCDSHTHIVYAGNREGEFIDRINGLSYQEIALKGGGILNSALKLASTSEEALYKQASSRINEIISQGTGAVEIKSGYGLTLEAEIKMLKVIKKLKANFSIAIKATFLGAHAFPEVYKNDEQAYIELIINEMMPLIAKEKLADFIDVFCENGYFSANQTDRILKAALPYGLIPKIHVNQFSILGGVKVGVDNGARSVDHLEILNDDDIKILKNSSTMPVALPGCSYFLGIPYTPARKIIDSGLPLALATDFNPGSSPSGNMNFVLSCACIKMNMSPEEAINAATLNGAYAMGLEKSHGSITKGKVANLIITKEIPSYGFLPYAFGSNHIDKIILNGKLTDD